MADARLWNVYGDLEFLTPGARETVGIVSTLIPPATHRRILEVAYGKGTGACMLAERHACTVLGVDPHPYAAHVMRRAVARGVGDRVAFAIGDGGRLPVRGAAFDLAICIGAPSIVGTERCLAEMARALRPGGAAVVSDWVWAKKPVPPAAIPRGYDIEPLTLDEYAAAMRRAGFEIISADPLTPFVWDAYYAPLRQTVAALRARDPEAPYQPVEDEIRIYHEGLGREYWRYAVLIGRKT